MVNIKHSKHIVIDARSRPSSTGRYIDRLIEHLQQIDHDNQYTILLRPGDKWQPRAKNFRTIECRYKQFTFNPLELITYGVYLRRLRPDLVHFGMSPQEPVFYFGKRVTTMHDLTMLRFTRAGRLPEWLHSIRMIGYRGLVWLSLRMAKHIIVPTNYVKDDVERTYPFTKPKITVTYEASEPPLNAAAKIPHGITEPFIMHIGSPFPHKNIERLILSFEVLKQTNPKLQLVLVGKKEYYFEQLEQWAKKESPVFGSIRFTGYVSDPELKWLLQNAEAYVLPSLSEGFGLPGLEAMTHGCPLVSSNATCLPEVYGEAAHYFDPESTEDMASKVIEVMQDRDLRRRLIQNGYVQIKKYSWHRMATQTLEVYKDVLNG